MVNLLNLHPSVLITHEADIVWILHRLHRGAEPSSPHPRDDAKGLEATLEQCGEILAPLSEEASIERLATAFHRFFEHVNENGRAGWDAAHGKNDLRWVGDKKPVQHADPRLRPFLDQLLPDARYLHVVRDPRYAVASMVEAARKWGDESVPPHWRGDPEAVLERWAEQEGWALALRKQIGERFTTVRLEDLAREPVEVLTGVFRFLGLEPLDDGDELLSRWVWSDPNGRHRPLEIPSDSEAARISSRLGYR